jgi:hypothetical protein
MKLSATEAAIICSTIEITRAISLIIADQGLSYKNINYPWVSGTRHKTKKMRKNDLKEWSLFHWKLIILYTLV